MASSPLPLPPGIQQQQSPEAAQSVFSAQGLGQPQPGMEVVQQIQGKLQELDAWAQGMKTMLDGFDPALAVLLQPIAQAGMDLVKAVKEKSQRSGMAQGSPVMPQQPPASPAAGPPNPAAQ